MIRLVFAIVGGLAAWRYRSLIKDYMNNQLPEVQKKATQVFGEAADKFELGSPSGSALDTGTARRLGLEATHERVRQGGLALAREFRDGSARAAGGQRRNTVVRRVRRTFHHFLTAGNRIGGKPTPVNGPGRRQHVDGGCYEWPPSRPAISRAVILGADAPSDLLNQRLCLDGVGEALDVMAVCAGMKCP